VLAGAADPDLVHGSGHSKHENAEEFPESRGATRPLSFRLEKSRDARKKRTGVSIRLERDPNHDHRVGQRLPAGHLSVRLRRDLRTPAAAGRRRGRPRRRLERPRRLGPARRGSGCRLHARTYSRKRVFLGDAKFVVLAFSSLFSVINPIEAAPIFVALTRGMEERAELAFRASLAAALILASSR
jgi:hypothetical protein